MTDFNKIGDEMFSMYKQILEREEREMLKGMSPDNLAILNTFKQAAATVAGDPSLSTPEKKTQILILKSKLKLK